MDEEDFNPFLDESHNTDLQQVRRQMEEEDQLSVEPPPIPQESAEGPVLDMPEAVNTEVETPIEKLGKYRGFQGRSKFDDNWSVPPIRSTQIGDHRWSESQYSIYKQRFLTSFISQQCQPWINSGEDYVFVDMFGGLGMWTDRLTGDYCAGSPMCIYKALEDNNVTYKGLVFEKDPKRAADLKNILYNKRDNIEVLNFDNRNCRTACSERGYDPALLYFDYTKQADSEHIRELTTAFPRSDVLIHYNAGAFKRAINSPLCDKERAHKGNAQYLTYLFNKRYWYINNWDELPHNKFNFVSIYGSNLAETSPLDEHNGSNDILHSYESERGAELRRKAQLSKSQLIEQ